MQYINLQLLERRIFQEYKKLSEVFSYRYLAEAAGVPRSTFSAWMLESRDLVKLETLQRLITRLPGLKAAKREKAG